MIRYLEHKEIDKKKWDECIHSSPNGIIYGLSWYLDVVCPGWNALVSDDYKTVMPLPLRKKFGIAYIFTPYFAQQLGIFGSDIDEKLVTDFFSSIPSDIKLMDIKLNESNRFPAGTKKVKEKKNYTLDISLDYDSIRSGYNRNCKRNLKKAAKNELQISDSISEKEFARFIEKNLEKQMHDLSKEAIDLLEEITSSCIAKDMAEIATIRNADGEIYAAGFYLFYKKRMIFSVCASSPEGKKNQAMHLLVDHQIRKYAGRYTILDFSGSEIRGIAYFNSTFGANPQIYQLVHINRLNWVQKVISGKLR